MNDFDRFKIHPSTLLNISKKHERLRLSLINPPPLLPLRTFFKHQGSYVTGKLENLKKLGNF